MSGKATYEQLQRRIKALEEKHAKSKKTEEELLRRLKLEKMLSDISTHAVSTSDIFQFKQECLDIMGEALDVSRIYIFEHRHSTDTMDNTQEWTDSGITSQKRLLQGISSSAVPWWIEMMRNNQIINFTNIEDIPGIKEKELLRQQEINSILVVPLFVQEKYFGFVGFDECCKHRQWLNEDVNLLRTISQIISGTIERLQSAQELSAEREQLLSIFESINQKIYVSDPHTHEILYVNDALKEAYKKNLVGGICYKELQNLESECEFCTNKIIMKQKYWPYQWEFYNHVLNRSFIVVDRIIKWPDGRDARFEIAIDITDRKTAEKALKESEEKYRQLFEMESDAIFLIDNDSGKILEFNSAAKALYGFTRQELLQMKILDLSAEPEETQKTALNLLTKIPVRFHRKKDGSLFPVEITARHFTWEGKALHVSAIRDITFRIDAEKEKANLETQLLQAQKMESIGTLAGGIAHDFNNLLMGIQGNASLMLFDCDASHPHCEFLKKIEKLVKSGSRLTSQLLGFARKGKYEVKLLNLNQLVKEAADTIGRVRKEIALSLELSEGLYAVEADHYQMEQVLLNLSINAADAMPNGGKISFKTSNLTHENIQGKVLNPKPGNYVQLKVTDTGVGMDQNTLGRIFDPFFTTKEIGRGTGLGLSSVYGIIKNHGGDIDVVSKKGLGTSFFIYLPCKYNKFPDSKPPTDLFLTGKETILIVDDEGMVLDIGVQMLKKLGYNVLEARSGRQAVEIYQKNKDLIDMVLLDMSMHEGGGAEICKRLKEIKPNIKVLLSSGYSKDDKAAEILNQGCSGFILKPFTIQKLSSKIKEML